jgi:hypothetical protein
VRGRSGETSWFQYTPSAGGETISADWKKDQPPRQTYVWVNNGQVSVCPRIGIEPLRGAHFSHIAEHPAESFLGPRAAPFPPVPIVVSDPEPETESDTSFPIPEQNASHTTPQWSIPPVDVTKAFGYRCAPAGTCEHSTKSAGTANVCIIVSSKGQQAVICAMCRIREEESDGGTVMCTPEYRSDLVSASAAAVCSAG